MTDALPLLEVTVLNHLAFGPRRGDIERLQDQGLISWLEEQLSPDDSADEDCARRLGEARLRIRYPATSQFPALDEFRPLRTLSAPIESLWSLADGGHPFSSVERFLPLIEVAAATTVRALYSRWQLREVLVDFWHNHFNIFPYDDAHLAVSIPDYDRSVIRAHCLGNFREMLEAVATSAAMLWCLNNRSSRAGSANENYARELFELHTLGRDAYLNDRYSHWRDVPGAAQAQPVGYIDQDVYEAARAFTGWAVEDGTGLGGNRRLPATGRFTYVEAWHDNYQKRVLASEFDPFQPPMADGRRVLDLVAAHPATARFVCGKLCRRLVADAPPQALLDAAIAAWDAHRNQPDQIAQTVRAIATSPAMAECRGAKVKRPLELAASFLRAIGVDASVTMELLNTFHACGQKVLGWPAPDGYPDTADYWLGSYAMRMRWALVLGLANNQWGTGAFDPTVAMGGGPVTAGDAVAFWREALLGPMPQHQVGEAILQAMALPANRRLDAANPQQAAVLRRIVAYCAMAPEFQRR